MRALAAAAIAGLSLALAACGSSETNPPPVEPATSPEAAATPVGTVTRLGQEAEGVVVDPETGLAVVLSLIHI